MVSFLCHLTKPEIKIQASFLVKQEEILLQFSLNTCKFEPAPLNDRWPIGKVESLQVKWNQTDLEKLARFCTTFAMRVSVRDVCSSGYSWVRLKSDGDMMAGHRKRRKREPLMRRSAMSSRPLSAQRTLQEANTSLSSRGKTLRRGYTAASDTNWRRLSDSLRLPGEESEVSSIFKSSREE